MVWAAGILLTAIVVIYVGYPLFVKETPAEDPLERAIAQRRGKGKRKTAGGAATAVTTSVGSVTCGRCGGANLPGDRFCASCGAALGRRCPSCGRTYAEGDLFCAGCGAKLTGR